MLLLVLYSRPYHDKPSSPVDTVRSQVGDSIDDMTAGYLAGAFTILLANAENEALKQHEHTDYWVERLDELVHVLEDGLGDEQEEE